MVTAQEIAEGYKKFGVTPIHGRFRAPNADADWMEPTHLCPMCMAAVVKLGSVAEFLSQVEKQEGYVRAICAALGVSGEWVWSFIDAVDQKNSPAPDHAAQELAQECRALIFSRAV